MQNKKYLGVSERPKDSIFLEITIFLYHIHNKKLLNAFSSTKYKLLGLAAWLYKTQLLPVCLILSLTSHSNTTVLLTQPPVSNSVVDHAVSSPGVPSSLPSEPPILTIHQGPPIVQIP